MQGLADSAKPSLHQFRGRAREKDLPGGGQKKL